MNTVRIEYIGRLTPLVGDAIQEDISVPEKLSAFECLEQAFRQHPMLRHYCLDAEGKAKRPIAVIVWRPNQRSMTMPLAAAQRLKDIPMPHGSRLVLL